MLRGDNIICGTTTTGTGTLTLAAPPTAVGGVGLAEFAGATGIGFVNGNSVLVSYTIIEFFDNTFAVSKSHEKGIGTLTLGTAYGGGTPHLLARTKLQTSATSLNSPPATQTIQPASGGTGISIGTAANTLVFIGPSAADIEACTPFYDNSIASGASNIGVAPMIYRAINFGNTYTSLQDIYQPFTWRTPMLVKRVTFSVGGTPYSGGTSNAYARIYDLGSDGKPGKLLIDFGVLGTGGSSLVSTGPVQSAAHASGYFLMPGEYYMDSLWSYSGGSGAPQYVCADKAIILRSTLGFNTSLLDFLPTIAASATSGTAGAGPDPANVTGWATYTSTQPYIFYLSPT